MNNLCAYFGLFMRATMGPLPALAAANAETAIESVLNRYQEYLSTNDVDAVLDLYSDSPVFVPEYAPPAVGRDAVRKAYEWVFANLKLRGYFDFHDIEVIGKTAWVRTTSTGHFRVKAT